MTTDGQTRAFVAQMTAMMSSAMRQVADEMRSRIEQMAADAVNSQSKAMLEQMTRTADAAESSYEAVKQIGISVEMLAKSYDALEQRFLKLLDAHNLCPHCNPGPGPVQLRRV